MGRLVGKEMLGFIGRGGGLLELLDKGRMLELVDREGTLLELVDRGGTLLELVERGAGMLFVVEVKGKGGLVPPGFEVPKRPRRFMIARLGKAARIALAWGLFIIAELLKRVAMFELAAELVSSGFEG